MRYLVVALIVSAALPAFAQPLSQEQEAFLTFESICMVNADRPDQIPRLLTSIGAHELPEDKAKPFLEPLTGKVFLLKGEAESYLIIVAEKGSCSLFARNADGSAAESFFTEHARNQLIHRENVGSEIHSTYTVSYPVAADVVHMVVMVDRSNIIADGIRFSETPERFMRAHELTIPTWP